VVAVHIVNTLGDLFTTDQLNSFLILEGSMALSSSRLWTLNNPEMRCPVTIYIF
jgi:hypothetical protein